MCRWNLESSLAIDCRMRKFLEARKLPSHAILLISGDANRVQNPEDHVQVQIHRLCSRRIVGQSADWIGLFAHILGSRNVPGTLHLRHAFTKLHDFFGTDE